MQHHMQPELIKAIQEFNQANLNNVTPTIKKPVYDDIAEQTDHFPLKRQGSETDLTKLQPTEPRPVETMQPVKTQPQIMIEKIRGERITDKEAMLSLIVAVGICVVNETWGLPGVLAILALTAGVSEIAERSALFKPGEAYRAGQVVSTATAGGCFFSTLYNISPMAGLGTLAGLMTTKRLEDAAKPTPTKPKFI